MTETISAKTGRLTYEAAPAAVARRRRGYLLLLISVLFVAVGLHMLRAALTQSTPLTVNLISSFTTFASFFILGRLWRRNGWTVAEMETVRWSSFATVFRHNIRWFLPATLLLALNGWLMNTHMSLYGAEMTAFLANLTFVFLVAAGWLSGERISVGEISAIVLILGGAFMFSYHGGEIAWGSIILMTGACAVTAGKQFLVKHISGYSPLPIVMTAVMGLSLPWTVILLFSTGQAQWPSLQTLGLAVLAALLTSVAGMTLLYRGYHLVGIARGAPFNTLRPVVVLLIGLNIGYAMPNTLQIIGGLSILFGSLALTLQKKPLTIPEKNAGKTGKTK